MLTSLADSPGREPDQFPVETPDLVIITAA